MSLDRGVVRHSWPRTVGEIAGPPFTTAEEPLSDWEARAELPGMARGATSGAGFGARWTADDLEPWLSAVRGRLRSTPKLAGIDLDRAAAHNAQLTPPVIDEIVSAAIDAVRSLESPSRKPFTARNDIGELRSSRQRAADGFPFTSDKAHGRLRVASKYDADTGNIDEWRFPEGSDPTTGGTGPSCLGECSRGRAGLKVASRYDTTTGERTGEYREPPESGYTGETDPGSCDLWQEGVIEAARDYYRARWDRIPSSNPWGYDYRSWLEKADDGLDIRCAYCGERDFGEYIDSEDVIKACGGFFHPGVLGWLVGTEEFRASILVHELVHRADYLFGPGVVGGGHWNGEDCSSTELRAAYMQAKFLQLSDCMASVFGCSYMRKTCGQSDPANLWSTAIDLLWCYGVAVTVVVAAVIVALVAVFSASALLALAVFLPAAAVAFLGVIFFEENVEL